MKIGFFAGQNRSAQFLVFDNFQIYETSLFNKIINFYFFVLYTPVILCAFHQLTTECRVSRFKVISHLSDTLTLILYFQKSNGKMSADCKKKNGCLPQEVDV